MDSRDSLLAETHAGSVDRFLASLSESGLIAGEDFKRLLEDVPPLERGDSRQLAQALVKAGKLTRYQAGMLLKGKPKGLVLGNYAILDVIGKGGMGMVFKAQHRRMERMVALKVLPPAAVKDPVSVQRFQREVKAIAMLAHPNVVAAYDADQAKGVHFLVMEYVDGTDLFRLVKRRGPLPVEQALGCILQAARGLKAAHQAGIVHRDIKPGNLLLDRLGTVKVLDLGLARLDAGDHSACRAGPLTQIGAIMGTSDYMAPEQGLDTKSADHRADIYSLGCTFYYLLTGKAMYAGATPMEKLIAHQVSPIPLLPCIAAELQAIYLRLVAKRAKDRFQSMSEVIASLEACMHAAVSTVSLTGYVPAATAEPLTGFLQSADSAAIGKTCPYCAEDVPPDTATCVHCGETIDMTDIDGPALPEESSSTVPASTPQSRLNRLSRWFHRPAAAGTGADVVWWLKLSCVAVIVYFVVGLATVYFLTAAGAGSLEFTPDWLPKDIAFSFKPSPTVLTLIALAGGLAVFAPCLAFMFTEARSSHRTAGRLSRTGLAITLTLGVALAGIAGLSAIGLLALLSFFEIIHVLTAASASAILLVTATKALAATKTSRP